MISTSEQVADLFKIALDKVSNEIKTIYAEFGERPTITELRKYNRLEKIEQSIAQHLREAYRVSVNTIQSAKISAAQLGYIEEVKAINGVTGLQLEFKPVLNDAVVEQMAQDNLWIESMKTDGARLLTGVKRDMEMVLRSNAREEVVTGLASGQSYRSVIKNINERFTTATVRSKTIVFTEMHKGHSAGRNEGITRAMDGARSFGIDARKVWRENYVGKPRPDHIAADGEYSDESGMFNVGGELLPAPGLGTIPENNINCHCSIEFEILDNDMNERELNKQLMEQAA